MIDSYTYLLLAKINYRIDCKFKIRRDYSFLFGKILSRQHYDHAERCDMYLRQVAMRIPQLPVAQISYGHDWEDASQRSLQALQASGQDKLRFG